MAGQTMCRRLAVEVVTVASGAFRVVIKVRPRNKRMKPKRETLADQVTEVPECGLILKAMQI